MKLAELHNKIENNEYESKLQRYSRCDEYLGDIMADDWYRDDQRLNDIFMADLRQYCEEELGKLTDKQWDGLIRIIEADERVYKKDDKLFQASGLVAFIKFFSVDNSLDRED